MNGYVLLPKSFETHTWVSNEAKNGVDNGNEKLTTAYSPVLGADVELLQITGLQDQSARNGS